MFRLGGCSRLVGDGAQLELTESGVVLGERATMDFLCTRVSVEETWLPTFAVLGSRITTKELKLTSRNFYLLLEAVVYH